MKLFFAVGADFGQVPGLSRRSGPSTVIDAVPVEADAERQPARRLSPPPQLVLAPGRGERQGLHSTKDSRTRPAFPSTRAHGGRSTAGTAHPERHRVLHAYPEGGHASTLGYDAGLLPTQPSILDVTV